MDEGTVESVGHTHASQVSGFACSLTPRRGTLFIKRASLSPFHSFSDQQPTALSFCFNLLVFGLSFLVYSKLLIPFGSRVTTIPHRHKLYELVLDQHIINPQQLQQLHLNTNNRRLDSVLIRRH